MPDSLEPTPPATAQELTEVIAKFEHYRQQLVRETLETAQRTKLPQATVMAKLEPELAKIDAALQSLRQQQADRTTN
jgi:hypothetical protein